MQREAQLKDRAVTLCFSLCLGDQPLGLSSVAHGHNSKVPKLLGKEGAEFKTGVAYTLQSWPQAVQAALHHLSNLLESSYFWPPETEFRVSFLFELVFPEMLIHCRKKQAVQGEQEENS